MLDVMSKLLFAVAACALLAPAALGQGAAPSPTPRPGIGLGTGSEESLAAATLNAQVAALFFQKKYDEALPLAEQAVGLNVRAYGEKSWRVAEALMYLGDIHLARKEYDKAAPIFQRALSIYETDNGPDPSPVTRALGRLAVVSYRSGEQSKAEEYASRGVSLAEQRHGADHLETARAIFILAELYRLRGETKKSGELYVRIAALAEKTAPASIPEDIVRALVNYLGSLYAQGRSDDSPEVRRIGKLLLGVTAEAARAGKEVKGGVLNGKPVYNPQPGYPSEAREARAQGTVTVRVVVDETGKVIEAEALSGNFALRRASENAAWRARFTPTLLSGVPVKVRGQITYNFVLR